MSNWIDSILLATRENEAPQRFFYWSALAAISAAIRKNVWLERWYYKLYPNIYVFLVAKSGLKKGIPVNLAKKLVASADCTRTISGRNSVQAIITDLSKAYTKENGQVISAAHGFLVSGELASFLIHDPDALTILTDLHNTHEYEKEWKNSLKSTGVEKLKSPCLTLLGATNEIHFADAVPSNAIGGGFIARTFIVFSEERGIINPLTEKPEHIVDVASLASYLREVSQVKGEFQWSVESKQVYETWYRKYVQTQHSDPTGTMERMTDQVIKVAMLLSLAEDLELVIRAHHIHKSLEVCLECVAGVRRVTMGAGKSPLAAQTKLVLQELIDRPDHRVERAKILAKYWGELDAFDLDRIIETLAASGAITVSTNRKTYVLTQSTLEQYTRYKEELQ